MRIHHLNCATLCPPLSKFVKGKGGWFISSQLVCHCLLIESDDGLILVDTGLGLKDIYNRHHLGYVFKVTSDPLFDPDETAVRQIVRLGYKTEDVRHIIVTHLDVDHAGGISDFPEATVHLFSEEYVAAQPPYSYKNADRYTREQWGDHEHWTFHYHEGGVRWFGFEAVHMVDKLSPEIFMIPLPGHTMGHCGIAVRTGKEWIFHCGDAYFYHGEVHSHRPHCPPILQMAQWITEVDRKLRLQNQSRLRDLARNHSNEIQIFCAHDPVEFDQFQT